MSPANVLDKYYLAITVLVTIGFQLSGFAIAWTLQFDKITDFTGGSNFFLLALLTLLMGNEYHTRNIVASVLVMIWAVRTAGFLLFRVLKTGSDTRFDEIRSHFFKFLGFWFGEIFFYGLETGIEVELGLFRANSLVSLPVTVLNSPAVSDVQKLGSDPSFGTACDIVGIILWGIGWIIESLADMQKFRAKNSGNAPKDMPVQVGVWRYSRHPNYFAEMLCWWGIWLLSISPTTNGSLPSSTRSAQYGTVVSPLFTMVLLMFGSGIPTAEKPTAKRFFLMSCGDDARYPNAWQNYKEYLRNTSILIPLPPALYRRLPEVIKRTVLLDFSFYQFDEGKDGAAAIEETRGDGL
ncbi:hypothetical protein D9758_006003 [Tetrapyrgos nigripes]|uniref:Steroid 5-alpha reductase C-terminal domain-containing protein n=1 Tax=Tetrapyrgos nigripes TaxID=182062 RepID=A0A8H5D8M0_9AGAR|nr:hypothetical protein D9758_006003 [Tetrapyrgos nigripes]